MIANLLPALEIAAPVVAVFFWTRHVQSDIRRARQNLTEKDYS